jgi:hypothetical protein
MQATERRSLERYELEVPVLMEVTNEDGTTDAYECVTQDVCSGGAFFVTDESFETGQRFKAKIKFHPVRDNGDPDVWVTVKGDVVRPCAGGIGARFDKKYQVIGIMDS